MTEPYQNSITDYITYFFLLCPNFLKVANITDPAAVTLFVSGGAN